MHIQTEPIPINVYVEQCFQKRQVTAIISTWKVESSQLRTIIVNNFTEMGIYFALPCYKNLILRNVLKYLKTSTEIINLVKKLEAEALRRQQQNRHSDV